jgi:hypothetical protein
MYSCLDADKTVRPITYELATFKRETVAVALACCCNGFEDQVLDATWETQRRLEPLLGTFPRDVSEKDYVVSTRKAHIIYSLIYSIRNVFKRPPTESKLARFRKYSRRARNLRPPSCMYLDVSMFAASQFQRTVAPGSDNFICGT